MLRVYVRRQPNQARLHTHQVWWSILQNHDVPPDLKFSGRWFIFRCIKTTPGCLKFQGRASADMHGFSCTVITPHPHSPSSFRGMWHSVKPQDTLWDVLKNLVLKFCKSLWNWGHNKIYVQASEKLIRTELSKSPDMDYEIVKTKDTAFANTGLRILNSRKNRKAENDE